MFEKLNLFSNKEKEISKTINETQKWLFWLEKWIIKKYFSQALNRLKNLFKKKSNWYWNTTPPQNENINHQPHDENVNHPPHNETIETPSNSDTISEEMFHELLSMEWSQNFVAKIHSSKFWESFVTWPYGMVYKHIDENGNLLKTPTTFKDGEKVDPSWAKENARAYYNKKSKQWKQTLNQNGCKYNQDMLDALVSASWWTTASYNHLKKFVISHRNDKEAIYNFWLNFATTAAWNGNVMPWLVRRRKFEANWFKWIKKPFSSYPVK